MAKGFKKILKLFIDIFVFIAFAILLIIIYAKVNMIVKNQTYFEVFGYSIFNIATGSMEPAISKEDIIIVKKQDDYKVGDIITFSKDNDFITHRIIRIVNSSITTKGDANNSSDVAISKDVVLGKVIKIIKHAGIWQKVLTKPIIVITIFITLILFDLVFSYKGNKNKKLIKKVDQVNIEKIITENNKYDLKKEEIKILKNKIKNNDSNLNDKEQKTLEYTIRLNLNDLQKEIDNELNKEE